MKTIEFDENVIFCKKIDEQLKRSAQVPVKRDLQLTPVLPPHSRRLVPRDEEYASSGAARAQPFPLSGVPRQRELIQRQHEMRLKQQYELLREQKELRQRQPYIQSAE